MIRFNFFFQFIKDFFFYIHFGEVKLFNVVWSMQIVNDITDYVIFLKFFDLSRKKILHKE